MQVIGSPDISLLLLNVTYDISGLLPVISVTNLSQGNNLPGVTYWFEILSPSGTIIHQGSFTTPDAVGAWTGPIVLTDAWPMPFSSIEWSGAPYQFTVFIQDSVGNQYNDPSYNATICRPTGNTQSSGNAYGVANTLVKVLCQQARIYFEDQTSTSYKGISGTLVSSLLKVIYPLDPTFSIPPPFSITSWSNALVPISYSSANYSFLNSSVYSYNVGTNVYVNIQYQQIATFPVWCNVDLMPLVCEFTNLINSIQNGSCLDVQTANQQLMLINPLFSMAVTGIIFPLTGIDVAGTINQIIEIGNFSCNCCSAPSGIIPQTNSIIDGYNFSVVPICGDITGNVTVTGSNIQINLQDKSYSFVLGSVTGTTAFSITPTVSGCTKNFALNVNPIQLATDIYNLTKTNAGLANLFNSLNPGNNNTFLTVDGKCIFTSTAAFAYTFTLAGIPATTTFALITGITKGAIVEPLTFSLNQTNIPAFQTYLNTLGLGAFVVTNTGGGTVLISSNANPNALSNLTYSISSTNFIATFTSVASGYVPISANQVVQNIINFICGGLVTDALVTTSQQYTISYIDSSGDIQETIVPEGSTLSTLISDLISANTETLTNIGDTVGVSCASIKSVFAPNILPITATDVLYGTTGGGACAPISLLNAFQYMLTAGLTNTTIAGLFCAFVEQCGQGLVCSPFSLFSVQVSYYNTTCAPIDGILYSLE